MMAGLGWWLVSGIMPFGSLVLMVLFLLFLFISLRVNRQTTDQVHLATSPTSDNTEALKSKTLIYYV